MKFGDLDPEEPMRRLVDFPFGYDEANPECIRLVTIENIHRAAHMRQSTKLGALNVSVIDTIADILARGQQSGAFRRDVDPIDLHMLLSSYCFFRVSNRHTFGAIFDRDLSDGEAQTRHKRLLQDAVLALLRSPTLADGGSVTG